jgi:hypothetical protein
MGTFTDVSPLSDHNSRFERSHHVLVPTTPIESIKNNQSHISVVGNRMFTINPSQSSRSTVIDDDDNEYADVPVCTQRKARPAPSTTWRAPIPIPKSSTALKTSIDASLSTPELPPSKFLLLHTRSTN